MKMEILLDKNFNLKFYMICNIILKKAQTSKKYQNKYKKNYLNNNNSNLTNKVIH